MASLMRKVTKNAKGHQLVREYLEQARDQQLAGQAVNPAELNYDLAATVEQEALNVKEARRKARNTRKAKIKTRA